MLTEGQEVKVKVIGVDDRGKVKLSMRLVDQETGEELPDTRPPREHHPRGDGDRGGRGNDRGNDRGGDRGGRGNDRGGDRNDRRRPRREHGERSDRNGGDGDSDPGLPAFLTGDD